MTRSLQKARRISIQIDEPWNFKVRSGGKTIRGLLRGTCQGPAVKNWQGRYLLVDIRPAFTWQGNAIRQVLIAPRYEGDTIADLQTGKGIIVGISRVLESVRLEPTQSFSTADVDYFAIGAAQLL